VRTSSSSAQARRFEHYCVVWGTARIVARGRVLEHAAPVSFLGLLGEMCAAPGHLDACVQPAYPNDRPSLISASLIHRLRIILVATVLLILAQAMRVQSNAHDATYYMLITTAY
jgi:hypothetical protein